MGQGQAVQVLSLCCLFVHKKCIWTNGAISNVAYCCIGHNRVHPGQKAEGTAAVQ